MNAGYFALFADVIKNRGDDTDGVVRDLAALLVADRPEGGSPADDAPKLDAVRQALNAAEPSETVYVLPTYTAMLALREILQRTGYVSGFWED